MQSQRNDYAAVPIDILWRIMAFVGWQVMMKAMPYLMTGDIMRDSQVIGMVEGIKFMATASYRRSA